MDVLIDQNHLEKSSAPPRCPRCGYDLSGTVNAWKDTCEIRGTCSECGYECAWADVLRPERQLPRWLFDYSKGMWGTWASAWKTFWMALAPLMFFRHVQLWHAPVVKRVVWWLPLLLIAAYVAATGMGCAALWLAFSNSGGPGMVKLGMNSYGYAVEEEWIQYLNIVAAPVGEIRAQWGNAPNYTVVGWNWQFEGVAPSIVFVGSAAIAWPLALLLMLPTRRIARIRSAHVLRCTIYSLGWLVVVAWTAALWRIMAASFTIIATMRPGLAGSSLIDELRYSHAAQVLWSPIAELDAGGRGWSLISVVFGASVLLYQSWWWYEVIANHWKFKQPRMTWVLLGIIAWTIAILAVIGPMSYRYIFMN